MSNLTDLLPAGGSGKGSDFVASGALSNGSTVVLKADGTVEVVAGSGSAGSIPAGSEVVFNTGTTTYISISFDPNTAGKFVITYTDGGNANYGTAVVGTVSGTSITFGSEYVFNSTNSGNISVSFDPNTANKFVVAYQDNGNAGYGTSIVGTVSGTSITFGSEYVFSSASTSYTSVSFDPNTANKFVVAYRDVTLPYYGNAIVGTVSGTTITFGTEAVFNSATTSYISVSFDPNTANKFVISYKDEGNSDYGTAIVGTVSGTSISLGTSAVFESANIYYTSVSFDPSTANSLVIAYRDGGNSNYGTAIVGIVSGTTISYGTAVVFNSGNSNELSVSFDPNTANKFVVAYKDESNAFYGEAFEGTVSGTSISFGSEAIFNSGTTYNVLLAFDPNTSGKFVVAYRDGGNSNYGTAIVGIMDTLATNLTSTNFLGTSDAAVSDTATGTITLKGGISTNQSGLTIGSDYYVQDDGTLSTTTSTVKAGRALNATTLKLTGE